MLSNIKLNDITNTDLPPIQVLLAESDCIEVARIRSNIDREFQSGVQVASNYDDLLAQIATAQPQLLLLGTIDRSNYFQICQECHKIQHTLEIVMISRQKVIDDCFRPLAQGWGAIDIISNDPIALNKLFQKLDRVALDRPITDPPIDEVQPDATPAPKLPVTGQTILLGLEEIATIGNNFFGPLAQGNYWRKSHAQIVDEFPFILNWSADHFGKLGCNPTILEQELTDANIQSLRIWVHLFIEECERIITDFGGILNNSDLSPIAKDLLAQS